MPSRSSASLALRLFGLFSSLAVAQKFPNWFTPKLEAAWEDLSDPTNYVVAAACKARNVALNELSKISTQEAVMAKYTVLEGLGYCDFDAEDYKKAKTRFSGALSEHGITKHRDVLRSKNQQIKQLAPVVFMDQAMAALVDKKYTEAGTALRRAKLVEIKTFDDTAKMWAKQNARGDLKQMKENFEMWKAKNMNELMKIPQLRSVLEKMVIVDRLLSRIDNALPHITSKRGKLQDAGRYAHAVSSPPYTFEGHPILDDVSSLKGIPEKADMIMNTRVELGCADDEWKELCALQKKASWKADVQSNIFGTTKVLQLKKDKHTMEKCEANSVMTVLFSEAAFTVHFGGSVKEQVAIPSKKAVLVDHCYPIKLEKSADVESQPVLVMQIWHPEVAPIERSTHIRQIMKTRVLDKPELVKSFADVVNKGTEDWDKTYKVWTTAHGLLYKDIDITSDDKKKQQEEAAKEADTVAENEEEAKKEALKKLAEKRKQQALDQETLDKVAHEKRARNAEMVKQLAKDKLEKNPWLETPIKMKDVEGNPVETTLKEQEEKLDAMKAEKRNLDATMEFHLSSDMLPRINKQQRAVNAALAKAKKAYKKLQKKGGAGGGDSSSDDASSDSKEDDDGADKKTEKLKSQLEKKEKELQDLEDKKKAAVAAEKYAEAKGMKEKIKSLATKVADLKAKLAEAEAGGEKKEEL